MAMQKRRDIDEELTLAKPSPVRIRQKLCHELNEILITLDGLSSQARIGWGPSI
jgi:hypothetical protein